MLKKRKKLFVVFEEFNESSNVLYNYFKVL